MDPRKKITSLPWWKWILGIDAFFVVTTIAIKHVSFPGLRLFNMSDEMNISVWWHGTCLFVASLLAYEFFSEKSDRVGTAWLSLSIIMLGFSLDEIGSLHERISLHSSTTPYKVIVMILFLYSISVLLSMPNTRKSATFILFGFVLYAAVVAQEKVEHLLDFPQWSRGIRAGVEEGSELVATFVVLWGIVSRRNERHRSEPLPILIPKPLAMSFLPILLLIGFVLHIYGSMVSSHYHDMRGIPASWFPSALFFLLSCRCYWESVDPSNDRSRGWLLLSAYFILCSMGAIQIFKVRHLPFYYFYMMQLPMIAMFFLVSVIKPSRKNIILLVAMLLALTVGFIHKTIATRYIVSGLVVYLLYMIFEDRYFPFAGKAKVITDEASPYRSARN